MSESFRTDCCIYCGKIGDQYHISITPDMDFVGQKLKKVVEKDSPLMQPADLWRCASCNGLNPGDKGNPIQERNARLLNDQRMYYESVAIEKRKRN